jgi:esterase/lipase superfamily enzyme
MPTTVYFASNRILLGQPDAVESYGPNIQPPSAPEGIVYGSAFVNGVDIAHDQPGSIVSIQNTKTGGFSPEILADLNAPGRNLLVFIHGFANTFEDAITRAAFNREFLAASGDPALDTTVACFSWPSLGRLLDFPVPDGAYRQDQKMATLSGVHLMSFFANLEAILRAARMNGLRTYLLAHSMGNLALQSAVENWFLHGNGNAHLFDAAVLAAADCRFDAFEEPGLTGLSGLRLLVPRIAVYDSAADKILKISYGLNGIFRLGQAGPKDGEDQIIYPPAIYRGFDATAVSDYDRNFITSHQYYRLSPTVRAQIARDLSPAATSPVAAGRLMTTPAHSASPVPA